jgi:chromosome segregation ATPase
MCRDFKGISEAAQQAQSELTTELQEKTEELEALRAEQTLSSSDHDDVKAELGRILAQLSEKERQAMSMEAEKAEWAERLMRAESEAAELRVQANRISGLEAELELVRDSKRDLEARVHSNDDAVDEVKSGMLAEI